MEEHSLNILNLLFVLVAAWVGGNFSRYLGYPAILGELIIGIILGPAILGFLNFSTTIKVLSDVGIILLMVYIGMEINFRDLKKASWPGLLASIGGFVVPFVLGYYTIIWFGGSSMSALFVAIAVGVTSLATKSRILVDLKLLNTRVAYVLMAGSLIADTLALLIFAGIISFADKGVFDVSDLLIVLLKAILFFAVTISIGLYVLPVLGRYLTQFKVKNSTFYFTMILIVAFGYAELAELAGMHSILGAFMAGLFIKDNLFPKNISKELNKAFYDVSIGFMAPIFFVSAGFFVDINVFNTDLLLLFVVIFVAVFGKIVGTALFYLPSGFGWREGITVGAGMNGRGAVEIIIAGIGLEMEIIDEKIFSVLVFMAIITTMMDPVLLKWATNWLRKRGELVQMGERRGFLLLGVNPVSLIIAKYLKEQSPVTIVDTNSDSVKIGKEKGFNCIQGNVLKEDVFLDLQPETISTFIGLTRNSEVNMLAAQLAKESFLIPNCFVTLSKNEDGAGIDMLDAINVNSMFAKKVFIDEWFSAIINNNVEELKEVVKDKTNTKAWIKKNKVEGLNILPLIIVSTEGQKRPFSFGDIIEAGESVVFLK